MEVSAMRCFINSCQSQPMHLSLVLEGQHPSHPYLHAHNTVCHVTPCVLPSSESRLEQCAFKKCLLCLWCQCQPMHPSLVLEGQSRVYHSRCILANLVNLMVLACLAKCGHCVRRSERVMALGMMSLQSNYLTHTW